MALKALDDLDADRQLGFGVQGGIPHEAMCLWAGRRGLDREATMILIAVIQKLDRDRAARLASKAAHT